MKYIYMGHFCMCVSVCMCFFFLPIIFYLLLWYKVELGHGMILTLPLGNYDTSSYVTVTREGRSGAQKKSFSSVTVSPSSDWFVVHDELHVVLCRFEVRDRYRLYGSLLFRQYGFDSSMLCLLGTNGIVADYNSSRSSLPTPLSIRNLHVGCGSEIVHVSFTSLDEVILVSSNCSVGCAVFDKQDCAFMGYFSSYRKLSGLVCCGLVPDSSLLAVLTRDGLYGVLNFRDSLLLNVSRHGIFSELGIPSSCIFMMGNKAGSINALATFPSSGSVYGFSISTTQENGDEAEKDSMNIPSKSYLWSAGAACSYVRKKGTSFLVASVWQDLVQFSTWENNTLSDIVVVENEMSVPYVSGFWVDYLFAVTRADGTVIPFSLTLNKEGHDGIKIVSYKHINLTSCCTTLLCGDSNNFLLLSLANVESISSGTPGAIFVTDSSNNRRFLQLCDENLEKPDTVLIDIVPFEENIAVINVKRSGECFAMVPSSSQIGSILLAHEEKPDKITSCLLYKRKELIFVTGDKHGGIHVWLSGTLKCAIPLAHTGSVDKLILLSQENEHLECDFLSVCTECGTVAVHKSGTFECTRILKSPCAPLTNLLWDQQTEYAFTVSGGIGNLWHLPTCSLERVFHNPSVISEGTRRRDLLTSFVEGGPVTIDRIAICGRVHFSLIVNVLPLVETLTRCAMCDVSPACRLGLSALFEGFEFMDSKLYELLGFPGRGLNGGGFAIPALSAEQSAGYILAIVLLARSLRVSAGLACSISTSQVKVLTKALESLGRIESPPPEKVIVESLPLLLQVSGPAKKVIRVCIRSAIEEITLPQLENLLDKLFLMSSDVLSVSQWFNVSNNLSDIDLWCYGFFVRMAILSDIPRTEGIIFRSTIEKVKANVPRLTQVLLEREATLSMPVLLLSLREFFLFFSQVVMSDPTPVVDAVAKLAFEGEKNYSALAIKTLISIAIIEGNRFFEERVKRWYNQMRSWRPRIISFLGILIESAPVESYSSFPIMTEFLLRALDPHNPNKEERDACLMPVTQVVRRATDYLPNVSFQQQLQYLAVGYSDGVVQVVNMKTTGIMASFVSHPDRILCVAYSSNTSSHDIAVLSEKMKTVKIWRANRHAGILGSVFASPMPEFRLKFTIDIPEVNHELFTEYHDEPLLMTITKCRLRWLSPHCVELSTPWHDKIQLTIG